MRTSNHLNHPNSTRRKNTGENRGNINCLWYLNHSSLTDKARQRGPSVNHLLSVNFCQFFGSPSHRSKTVHCVLSTCNCLQMWRNIKFDMCNLYYTCLHVCVCVCLCVCVIHWRYLIHERDIVHVFVCRNRKKTTRVKIYNAIKLNFYLGLLRIHKEFPILSVRSMLCLENLVHCLFLKKCLIEVKMGFICGFFLKWEIFCCHFLFVIVLLIVFWS